LKTARTILLVGLGVFVTLVVGLFAWIVFFPEYSMDVPDDFRGSVAASVYGVVAPRRGESIDAVDSRFVAVGKRTSDTWVIALRDSEPIIVDENLYMRSYLFNDSTVLTTYALIDDDGRGWVFDGVRFSKHVPGIRNDQ